MYKRQGYNYALEIIPRYSDVPDIVIFQMNTAGIEDKIQALNELVPILYKKIRDTDYEDKELKAVSYTHLDVYKRQI